MAYNMIITGGQTAGPTVPWISWRTPPRRSGGDPDQAQEDPELGEPSHQGLVPAAEPQHDKLKEETLFHVQASGLKWLPI